MRFSWMAALILAALPAFAALSPASAQTRPLATSTNWAGYAATTSTYTSVSTAWTQPKITCQSASSSVAFWAGLDGYNSSTVEQAGVAADCVSKKAAYTAFYELYPNAAVSLSGPVKPGDTISASVSYAGSNKFTIKITDSTQGWSNTVTATLAGAARSSAEIIVDESGAETISSFGSVTFTSSMVNGANLCKSNPTVITGPDLSVSAITGCTSFTVTQTRTP